MKQGATMVDVNSTNETAARKRVVIYTRISKDRVNETSTTTQAASCRAYAESKGWEVVEVLTDAGRSAFKPGTRRDELDRALHLMDVGAANVLLVWKLDRFTRSTGDFAKYWDRIKQAGGQFASVTESFDTTTPMGRAMLKVVVIFAELESAVKSERAQEWNDYRTANGTVPCGPRPFGYQRDNGTLVVDPMEGPWLRDAAQRILAGESIKGIVNDSGMVGARGTALTARGLRAALLNPTTAGFRHDDGRMIKGTWAPIIDADTHDKLVALLTDPSRVTGQGNQVRHLLSGILSCGKEGCDGKLGLRNWHTRGKPNRPRYTCLSCGNSIWQDAADEAIAAYLMTLVPQDEWAKLRTQGRGYNPAVIAELEAEADKYVQMAVRGIIKAEALEEIMSGINERMASATGDEALVLPDVANLHEAWATMNVNDQRRVLRAIFETVTLNPASPDCKGIARLDAVRKV